MGWYIALIVFFCCCLILNIITILLIYGKKGKTNSRHLSTVLAVLATIKDMAFILYWKESLLKNLMLKNLMLQNLM